MSTALVLAIVIGVFEALALLVGSGLLLRLMGISVVCFLQKFPTPFLYVLVLYFCFAPYSYSEHFI